MKFYIFYKDDFVIGIRSLGAATEDYFVSRNGDITVMSRVNDDTNVLQGELADKLINKLIAGLDADEAIEVRNTYNNKEA